METNQTEEQLKLIHKQHKKTERVFPRIMYGYDMTNKGSSKPSIYTQIKHTVSFSALIHKYIIKSVSIQPRTTKNTHVPPSKSKIKQSCRATNNIHANILQSHSSSAQFSKKRTKYRTHMTKP